GPGVEPELECPVLANGGIRAQEGADDLGRGAGFSELHLGLLEILARDPLKGGGNDVVHRLEVVVDEAAGAAQLGCHIAYRGRGKALTSSDSEGRVDDRVATALGGHASHRAHSSSYCASVQ